VPIVIAGTKNTPETKALLDEVNRHFLPKTVLFLADGAEGQKYFGKKNEAVADRGKISRLRPRKFHLQSADN